MEKSPEQIIQRFNELQSSRNPHEAKWKQIADFMRPMRLEFRSVYDSGQLPAEQSPYQTSGVAGMALDNFVGGIYGYLSNEANQWLSFKTFDDDLNSYHTVKTWLATVSRRVLNSFGPSMCPFYTQAPELYADVAGLGNGAFLSEWKPDRQTIYDRAYSPFDVYFDTNNYNEIDTCYRPLWWTKRNIKQKWPDAVLPVRIDNCTNESERFMLLHVVMPNADYSNGFIGSKGMPYNDLYVAYDDKVMLQDGGRWDFYQAARWSGNGTYGYGLGHRVLPDAKTHNAMDRSMLEYSEWQAHPTPLMPDRNFIGSARPLPRKPLYGGMSMGGRPMVQFLAPQGNVSITHEMMQSRAEQIREGFYFGLMQLAGRSGMTVVETMARDEERMRLLGPHVGRIQREFLSPATTQRFMMLWRAGQLPPPPPELTKGQQLRIDYVSPMANAQKSAGASGTLRLIDATLAVSKMQPEAVDNLDGDAALRILQEGFSAPVGVIRSPDQVAQLREQRAQQQQMQQQLQMGQQGADIASKLATVVHPRNMGMKAA